MTSPKLTRAARPLTSGIGVRVAAVAAAIVWGIFYFGVIDLLVVPIQDDQFDVFYLVETGWGLLYTVLVALPLVLFAVRPRVVFLQQVAAVALAVLACAVITPAWRQVVTGVLLLLTALLLSWWSGQRAWQVGSLRSRRLDPWLGALVVVAAAGAVWYAAEMIQQARSGRPDDDTWGLMHLPMQAAFGLALAGSAAVTWLVASSGGSTAAGWRVSAVPAAVSACWLGVVSLMYPDHLASLGDAGGVAAIAWGLLFGVAAMTRGREPVDRGRSYGCYCRRPCLGCWV